MATTGTASRSETIDAKEPFRTPFHAGQRGIVLFRTFNEGEEVVKPSGKTETRQWTIDPKDGRPRGFAFMWRRFEISDLPAPMRRTIKSREDDPRMPAILEDAAHSHEGLGIEIVWGSPNASDDEVGQIALAADVGRDRLRRRCRREGSRLFHGVMLCSPVR